MKDVFDMVGPYSREHFKKMTPEERKEAIRDAQRQLDYIAATSTAAADYKRAELDQRIGYLRSLENT